MNRLQRRWSRRLQRLEAVLQYIEKHCCDGLDVAALAAMASISPFHFHRVFSAHVGEPVLGYIRRLRLEKAAWRILYQGCSITEVAMGAGYSSAAAFTRAFRSQFGKTPRNFARDALGMRRKCGLPNARGPLVPAFVQLPLFHVTGVRRLGAYGDAPAAAWEAMQRHLGSVPPSNAPRTCIGIPLDWPELTAEGRRRYEACVVAELPVEGELFRKQVGGGTYATFPFTGTCQELQGFQEGVYWEWKPPGNVRLRDGPALHLFGAGVALPGRGAPLVVDVCIPVDLEASPCPMPADDPVPLGARC